LTHYGIGEPRDYGNLYSRLLKPAARRAGLPWAGSARVTAAARVDGPTAAHSTIRPGVAPLGRHYACISRGARKADGTGSYRGYATITAGDLGRSHGVRTVGRRSAEPVGLVARIVSTVDDGGAFELARLDEASSPGSIGASYSAVAHRYLPQARQREGTA
jgi:hypothetical protein